MREDEWNVEVGNMGVVVGGDAAVLNQRDAAVNMLALK